MVVIEFFASICRQIADSYFKVVFLALAVVFMAFGPHIFPLKINNTLATLLEQDTPQEKIDNEIKKVFGDLDEVSILAYTSSKLFNYQNLALIKEMTAKISAIDGVRDCFSLSSTPFFRNVLEDGLSTIYSAPLLDSIPQSPEALERLKADALGNKLFVKNIVSPDGNTAAFNIIFQPDVEPFRKEAIVREIRKLALEKEKTADGKFYFTGMHVFMETTGTTMQLDVELFSLLSLVVLFFALLAIFRNIRLAFVGLSSAIISNGLLFVTIHILGRNLSISTTPVPAITMGLALAYSLHFLVAKHEGKIEDPDEIQEMFVGAFFSGLTSIIGFLSLCLNPIPTLQDFGLFAAIGTFFAGWTALFVTYPILKLIDHKPNPHFARRFKFLLRFASARFRRVIITIAILLFAGGALIFRMEVQTDYYRYYLKTSPMTKAVDFVNRTIGGQYPIVVEIDSGKEDGVFSEKVLAFLERFKKSFEGMKGVDKVITYLDLLNEGCRAFDDGPPAFWYRDRQKVSQIAMLVHDANPSLNGYYENPAGNKTLIFVRTNHINSASFLNIYRNIIDFTEKEKPPEWKFQVGGTYLRCVNSADNMAIGQFEGTFWEIIVLFSCAFFIIRSIRLTVIAFLANLLPIFGVYGLLSLIGETLNMGTTMIAAISLGIGIDDTIHFVVRYLNAFRKYHEVTKSTRTVIYSTGVSMFLAASMIACSLLTLAFSNIKPIYQLGIYTVVTMVLCFAANMFLVPVLITSWFRQEKRPKLTINQG